MKRLLKLSLFLISITLLPGCKPVKVVGFSPGVEPKTLLAFKTFNVYKLVVTGNQGPNFAANFELCKKSIAAQMTSRGFKEVEDSGELAINIGILLSSSQPGAEPVEMQYAKEPDYSWLVRQSTKEKAKVGTITIEIINASKREGLWIGSFSGAVPSGEAAKQKKINQGIDLLFENFPVGKFKN